MTNSLLAYATKNFYSKNIEIKTDFLENWKDLAKLTDNF